MKNLKIHLLNIHYILKQSLSKVCVSLGYICTGFCRPSPLSRSYSFHTFSFRKKKKKKFLLKIRKCLLFSLHNFEEEDQGLLLLNP